MDEPYLVPASDLSLAELTTAFNRAFEGYLIPLNQTPESLQSMVRVNDIDVGVSLVARAADADGSPVGIGLLAVRGERAWVGGMGVAPEWRGHGHGTALMRALLARARAAGVRRVQLEVLEDNAPARHLYQRLGFVDERTLLIFTGKPAGPYPFAPLADDEAMRDLPADEALDRFDALHGFAAPCWQREVPSLRHMASGARARGVFAPDGLRAYVLCSPAASGVALLDAGSRAAEAGERVRHLGALVQSLAGGAVWRSLRAINVPPGDPLGDVLTALGCPVVSSQREMSLALSG